MKWPNSPQGYFTLNGRVTAKESSAVSTRVMGSIASVNVEEGQRVSKGQVLASINKSDLNAKKAQIEANIQAAEAGLENASKTYKRFKNLYESNSVTLQEYNNVEMQYKIAKSQVTAAKEGLKEIEVQMGYATITAPFSGIISSKMA